MKHEVEGMYACITKRIKHQTQIHSTIQTTNKRKDRKAMENYK